ncbi:tryptophan 7-halogenase [Nocardia sp. CDC159]|uniref:Tryptophan 7-halogenase n=1 Tax=Nocardia pulmonis TaxID=2951408 RepID=A0A9X2E599_9NOCA|nr:MULTISPECIES: NAD(P)/FAD-dependent oxidoreductase [Nocardia]MCM6774567.1 tryptophan 7-halogenase [Nocardia pulmonis]MCM6787368.1 tryptophan 7-halogenase [Nocardia sp. CDC159]
MTSRVLIIGGGPGGANAAALLAQAGLDVTLLEREKFPRYHIGESLASSCRTLLGMSGVVDKVDAYGFPIKRGALLRWGNEEDWTIDWSGMFGRNVSSWQVEREEFDQLLLDHAEVLGAKVIQGATVKRVLFDGAERPYAAEWVDGADPDSVRTIEFDTVIDASGRAGVLSAQHFRDRKQHEIFRNVAIWGYWQGGKTLPNTPEGGIDVISHPEGWYWIIPLRKDRFSVGFVTHRDTFRERRAGFDSHENMLLHMVGESETVSELLRDGTFEPPVRIEQDYSYVADSFCGDGYFLVGDAACFLDPLLSTGVHLALYSGMLAAATTIALDRGDVTPEEAKGFYESLYRNAYARLFLIVSGVYEQYKGKDSYFWLAQRLVRPDGELPQISNAAFVEIVAGLSDLRDAGTADAVDVAHRLSAEAQKLRSGGRSADGRHRGLAPLRIEPTDLYQASSGLYLRTTPELGIGRA